MLMGLCGEFGFSVGMGLLVGGGFFVVEARIQRDCLVSFSY